MPDKNSEAVLEFIKKYKRENQGTSPTYDEIADHVGVTKSTAKYHVERLQEMGRIEWRGTRNIFILDPEESEEVA